MQARLNAIAAHTNRHRSSAASCSTCTAHCASAGEANDDADDGSRAMMRKLIMSDPAIMQEMQKDGVMDAVKEIMSADDKRAAAMKYRDNPAVMAVVAKLREASEEEAAPAAPPTAEELDERWAAFPIINPFGDDVHLDDLVTMRAEDPASSVNMVVGETDHDLSELAQMGKGMKYAEEVVRKTGKIPPEMQAFFDSDGDPRGGGFVDNSEIETNPLLVDLLHQMVANTQDPSRAIHDANPTVLNGHATYADEERFEAETQVLFRESPLIVGMSGDLPVNNDFKRFEVAGKSMLLTRDSSGVFHAFENACRHRGMELVSVEAPVGNKRLHVCPYHAWAYGSDGELMSV